MPEVLYIDLSAMHVVIEVVGALSKTLEDKKAKSKPMALEPLDSFHDVIANYFQQPRVMGSAAIPVPANQIHLVPNRADALRELRTLAKLGVRGLTQSRCAILQSLKLSKIVET